MPVKTKEQADEVQEVCAKTEMQQITREVLEDYVNRLRESCGNFDSDELVSLAEELAGYCYEEKTLKPYMEQIAAYAGDFEYDSAEETICRMLQDLQGGKEQG